MRKLLLLTMAALSVPGRIVPAQDKHEANHRTCDEVTVFSPRRGGNMFDPARDNREIPADAVLEVRVTKVGDERMGDEQEIFGTLTQPLCTKDGKTVAPVATVVRIRLTATGDHAYSFRSLDLSADRRSYLVMPPLLQPVAPIYLGEEPTRRPHAKASGSPLKPGYLLRFSVKRTVSPTIIIN